MKIFRIKKYYVLIFLLFSHITYSQENLTFKSALEIALEDNLDIKIKLNQEKQAKNINNIGSAGLLPKINIIAAGSANQGESSLEFATNDFPSITDANSESSSINTGVELNYNVFNGFASIYTFQRNNKLNEIKDLETQIEIETIILKLAKEFFDVFYLQEQRDVFIELISISEERFQKIKIQHDFGNVSKLDLLSAELDLNNDSIDFKRLLVQLDNAKNSLNQMLNRDIDFDFFVSVTDSLFLDIKIDDLLEKVKANNLIVMQKYRLDLSRTNKKINNSMLFPKIGLSAQYGYNVTESNTSLISNQTNLGFTGALNISWGIFDGFSKRKLLQNANIEVETNKYRLEAIQQEVKKELINLYNKYLNNLDLIKIESKSVFTAKNYFDRAREQYFEGFIDRNEFRLAQLDHAQAKTRLNQTIFNTKILQLTLFNLSGEIIQKVK